MGSPYDSSGGVESPPSHDRAVGERPLDDLAIASGAATAVEKLIRQTVAEARKQGRTWAEIGHASHHEAVGLGATRSEE